MSESGRPSGWAIGAIVVLLCAIGLHAAGYATNYWMQSETVKQETAVAVGLWRYENCSGGFGSACNNYAVPSAYKNSSFVGTQALASIVLILMVVILVIFIFYIAADKFRELAIAVTLSVMCFFTVVLSIVCMIVWLVQIPSLYYPGYSFGLTVFAYLLLLLTGLLLIPDIRNYGKKREIIRVSPERYSDYDEVRRERYNREREYERYNKSLENKREGQDVRHYYNPNRRPLVRTPPPRYSSATPDIRRKDIKARDLYLGTPPRRPHRF